MKMSFGGSTLISAGVVRGTGCGAEQLRLREKGTMCYEDFIDSRTSTQGRPFLHRGRVDTDIFPRHGRCGRSLPDTKSTQLDLPPGSRFLAVSKNRIGFCLVEYAQPDSRLDRFRMDPASQAGAGKANLPKIASRLTQLS